MAETPTFLAHVALRGLFEVYVLPIPGGTLFQFYAYPGLEAKFPEYLASRFSHLGSPADCAFREDIRCYEVTFTGLTFKDPEAALEAIIRSPSTPRAASAPGAPKPR